MRLRRRFSRTLPTEETVSPGTAAFTAAQAGNRGAILTGAAAGIAQMASETRRQIIDTEDQIAMSNRQTAMQVDLDAWEVDPKYQQDQIDGRPTPEVMAEDYQKIMRRHLDEGGAEIQNPLTRQKFEANMADAASLIDVEAEKRITDRRLSIIQKNGLEAANAAADVGNFEDARSIIESLSGRFQGIADNKRQILAAIDKKEVDFKADAIQQQAAEAYQVSMDAGDTVLNRIIGDTEMDPDVRNAAIAAVSAEQRRATQFYKKQVEAEEASYERNVQDDMRQPLSMDEIDARTASAHYGPPNTVKSERRRARVIVAQELMASAQSLQTSVDAMITSGQMLPNEKRYREAVGDYTQRQVEGMTPAEARERSIEIFRTAGTTSEAVANQLQNGNNGKEQLQQALGWFVPLTEGEMQPELNVSGETLAMLEAGKAMMATDSDFGAAAQAVWENAKNVPETVRTARRDRYAEEGQKQANTGFKDLGETFGDLEFLDQATEDLLRADYSGAFKFGYEITGSWTGARNYANRHVSGTWALSNLNGKPTVTKWGIPNDSTDIRSMMNEGLRDVDVAYLTDEGTHTVGKVNPDLIEYRVVGRDEGTRTIAPYVNGAPIQRMVMQDGGLVAQKAQITLTDKEITENQVEYAESSKQIRDLERAERRRKRLEAALASPRLAVPVSQIKEDLESVNNQIAALEANPNVQRRRQAEEQESLERQMATLEVMASMEGVDDDTEGAVIAARARLARLRNED